MAQIRSPARRALAARDPLLHYLIIGWREHRAPNTRFEPRFFDEDLGFGRPGEEPFYRFLRSPCRGRLAQNEVEAASSLPLSCRRPASRALIFHHGRGGGSSKFLALFERRLRDDGIEPIRLRAILGSDRLVIWPNPDGLSIVFDLEKDSEGFFKKLEEVGISLVIVSHLIDFFPGIFSLVERCRVAAGGNLWVILHDYYSLCPRVNLVDAWQKSCDVAPPEICRQCVMVGGAEIGGADPLTWRRDFGLFLAQAHRVFAPSGDAERRLSKHINRVIEVWRPESDVGHPPALIPRLRHGDDFHVAVLGSLNQAKGGQVILELARRARKGRAPLKITVFGTSNMTRQLRRQGVMVRGRYKDDDLPVSLGAAAPHMVFIPAIWPETWSFVLTHALEQALPVMTFAHGAQNERMEKLGRTDLILPLHWIVRPDLVLARLLEVRQSLIDNGDVAS